MKINYISLDKIVFEDNTYSISPPEDDNNALLLNSINRVGILHPPIVKESLTGTYTVVNGKKRLKIAKDKLKKVNCNCYVIPKNADEISVWTIYIESILQERELTPIEKGEFFKKVIAIIPNDEVAKLFLPLMGCKPQSYLLKQYLPLAELEEHLKVAIQQGRLDHKAALTLSGLSFRNRLAIFEIIENLQLSKSNQKKFISICLELEKRQKTNVISLISEPEFIAIINSNSNTPQKANHIMKYLADKSHPLFTQALKEHNTFVKQLELPANINLSHSPSFETDNLTVNINFNNKNDFLAFWDRNKDSF